MKRISILVTYKAIIAAIGNSRHLFNKVNEWLRVSGQASLFDVELVGLTPEVVLSHGLYSIKVDRILEEVGKTDLIIIPPMTGEMEVAVKENKNYLPWIKKQYKKGSEVASLCVGAFILAETGLLDKEECSTHWETKNEFKKRFPNINLVDSKIITDHNRIYTSGGANSYWNLLVYLIQKFTNRDIAILAAKYFEVEIDRNNQLPFMVFEGYKHHSDETILEAQAYIEQHYTEKLTLDFLSKKYAMSTRTFQRRFKKATHETFTGYLQKLRIESAKKLLESTFLSINEIMYKVGYNDPKTFRGVFKRNTGISPIEYKKKYKLI